MASRYFERHTRQDPEDPLSLLFKCKSCGVYKKLGIDNFRPHGGMRGGFRTKCRECGLEADAIRGNMRESLTGFRMSAEARKKSRDRDRINPERARAYSRARARLVLATPEGQIDNKVKTAKYRAVRHNLPFNLSCGYVKSILREQDGKCAITGEPMTFVSGRGIVKTNMSIDRIESRLGYTQGNIQLVCHYVNTSKQDMNNDELRLFCEKVMAHNGRTVVCPI